MKSRQRSSKRNQRFSEGWQQAVLKLPDSTTNSTALSPEITKSATHGQTHTNCRDCDALLTEDNWTPSFRKNNNATCKLCYKARHNTKNSKITNPQQMHVNGKYVSKKHPLYKAGKYKGFEDAAFSSLANYKTSPQGQVYIITNPAWEGWVKVGMAVDADDRLGGYQTSSPYRDYTLAYTADTPDRRATEAETHNRLADIFEQRNEWFKCDVETAKRWLDTVIGEFDEAC